MVRFSTFRLLTFPFPRVQADPSIKRTGVHAKDNRVAFLSDPCWEERCESITCGEPEGLVLGCT